MQNYQGTADYLWLIVGAEGNSPVQFGVETNSGVIYTGTTTSTVTSPVTVNLPSNLLTNSAAYTYRNKIFLCVGPPSAACMVASLVVGNHANEIDFMKLGSDTLYLFQMMVMLQLNS